MGTKPYAERSLVSLTKSLNHHVNRLKDRMAKAEVLQLHVAIWPVSPAAGRLATLKAEMQEDWDEGCRLVTEITARVASALGGLDPGTIGVSTSQSMEVEQYGQESTGGLGRPNVGGAQSHGGRP